ncbi:MAG: aldolase [Spirochaetia bacterium]|nr:aldolase [Spirochaetia bacterium]
MNNFTIPEKLRNGIMMYGTLVVSSSPLWPEVIAASGVDFVFIDTEHIPLSREQTALMCRMYAAMGLPPLLRIPSPDPVKARMALDGGAAGIIAPYIENKEQVEGLIGSVKKRPIQGESLQRILQSSEYASQELESYVTVQNQHNALILNIESRTAVDNLHEILRYPEVDAVLIGPHDLSCSMGIPEQYDNPIFKEMVIHIIRTAREFGKGAGYHKGYGGEGIAFEKELIKQGMNLVLHEADIIAVQEKIKQDLKSLKSIAADKSLDTSTQ